MTVFWILVEISADLFEALILFSFFNSFLPRRYRSKWIYLVLPFFQTALIYLLNQTPLDQFSTALSAIAIAVALVMVFYSGKVWNEILLTLAFYAVWMASELGLLSLLNAIFPDFIMRVDQPSIDRITAMIVCNLAIFLILKVVQRLALKNAQRVPLRKLLPLFSLPVITILLIISLQSFWVDQTINARFILASVGLIALLFANLIIFDLYNRLYREAEAASQLQLLQQHVAHETSRIQMIENQNREVRQMVHDMKNSLLPLRHQIDRGDVARSGELLARIMEDLGGLQQIRPITGNSLVDTVLANKMDIAKSRQVRIEVKQKLNQEMFLPDVDLCVMLGNALDNAIEATEQVADPDSRLVRLSLMSDKGVVILSVENPVTHALDFQEGRYRSTKPDGDNHGLGLESIRRLAEKNGGYLRIDTKDHHFDLSIYLPNQPLES